jgi:LPS-assembly lipoprotein
VRRALLGLLLLGPALGLSGCGFKPRPVRLSLPFERIYIREDKPQDPRTHRPSLDRGQTQIIQRLREALGGRLQKKLVNSAEQAEVILRIYESEAQRIIVGYSGTGRPREVELRLRLAFRIEDRAGRALVPADELDIRRTIRINESDVLATDDAERSQQRVMEEALVQEVLRRLEGVRTDAAAPRS